jgi:hypothetical protein
LSIEAFSWVEIAEQLFSVTNTTYGEQSDLLMS